MALDSTIAALEKSIDDGYQSLLPKHRSWELVASHVLLAHAGLSLGMYQNERPPGQLGGFAEAENRKFGLMHALRFLHHLRSRPFKGRRASADRAVLRDALALLDVGTDYDAITSAFTQLRAGALKITRIDRDAVELRHATHEDLFFDRADQQLHVERQPQHEAFELGQQLSASARGGAGLTALLQHGAPEALLELSNVTLAPSWQLPPAWRYRGTSIEDLRRFWSALLIVALFQLFTASAKPAPPTSWAPTLYEPVEALVATISTLSGLDPSSVELMLSWHEYDRGFRKSDVALTPFLAVGADHLLTSPELIISSNLERNFYAHRARVDADAIDATSNLLAPEMSRQLAQAFRDHGFQAACEIPFTCSLGTGDVDLLVWSPRERLALALELKWFIQAADYREVLNRHEAAAKALADQLPKYRAVMDEQAAALLQRAFSCPRLPVLTGTSVGLILRNHTGSARLRTLGEWFAPEEALLRSLGRRRRLRDILEDMAQFSWLPGDGSVREYPCEVVTPNGISVSVPGYVPEGAIQQGDGD